MLEDPQGARDAAQMQLWAGNEKGRWPWRQSSPCPTAALRDMRTQGALWVPTEGQWLRWGDNNPDPHAFLQNLEVWPPGEKQAGGWGGEEGWEDIRPLHSELLWVPFLHWMQLTLPSSAGRP